MPSDGAFMRDLPRLVEGFDHIEIDAAHLRENGELPYVPSLVDTARLDRTAWAACARPARLADEQLLVGRLALKIRVQLLYVRHDVVAVDRMIVPVGKDVHGHE
jgi:hypothetical protein